jgi:LmbE family N-acetylglucosaminyl deacetylase
MNVLVIAPHPDDESIGCGGAVVLHVARGDRVSTVFLTSGELGLKHLPSEEARLRREAEAAEAAEVLGTEPPAFFRLPDWYLGERVGEAAALLRPLLVRDQPGAVYLPHPGDSHPDHGAALPALLAALSGSIAPPPEIWSYEVWTPLSEYDRVVDITPVMARKLRAVRCHRSQCCGIPYDRAVRGLNLYRGVTAARCRYAEVFLSVTVPRDTGPPASADTTRGAT